MKRFAFGFFVGLCLLSVACQPPRKSKSPGAANLPNARKYFVHGSPYELIAGTSPDATGLIASSDVENYNNYRLVAYMEFRESVDKSSVNQIESQEELENENSTSGSGEETYANNYVFDQSGTTYSFRDPNPEAQDWPVLNFEEKNGFLVLKSVGEVPVKGLHYSVKADGEAMSILFDSKDDSGSILAAFYFVKGKGEQRAQRFVDAPENYFVSGDGIAIAWERDIEMHVCGKNASQFVPLVQRSLDDWSQVGGYSKGTLGKRSYKVVEKKDPRPFSDLNQNCVNFVDKYRKEDQEGLLNMGITLPIIDDFDQEIIQSQIFIFLRATDLSGNSRLSVLTHEMGHALGLGHEFPDQLHFKAALPSIMGYGEDDDHLTTYDGRAIRYLYGE